MSFVVFLEVRHINSSFTVVTACRGNSYAWIQDGCHRTRTFQWRFFGFSLVEADFSWKDAEAFGAKVAWVDSQETDDFNSDATTKSDSGEGSWVMDKYARISMQTNWSDMKWNHIWSRIAGTKWLQTTSKVPSMLTCVIQMKCVCVQLFQPFQHHLSIFSILFRYSPKITNFNRDGFWWNFPPTNSHDLSGQSREDRFEDHGLGQILLLHAAATMKAAAFSEKDTLSLEVVGCLEEIRCSNEKSICKYANQDPGWRVACRSS